MLHEAWTTGGRRSSGVSVHSSWLLCIQIIVVRNSWIGEIGFRTSKYRRYGTWIVWECCGGSIAPRGPVFTPVRHPGRHIIGAQAALLAAAMSVQVRSVSSHSPLCCFTIENGTHVQPDRKAVPHNTTQLSHSQSGLKGDKTCFRAIVEILLFSIVELYRRQSPFRFPTNDILCRLIVGLTLDPFTVSQCQLLARNSSPNYQYRGVLNASNTTVDGTANPIKQK